MKLKLENWFFILIILLSGYGAVLAFNSSKDKETKCSFNHKQEIDSLKNVIQENIHEIKALERTCRNKELEIAYWGRMYENCKLFK